MSLYDVTLKNEITYYDIEASSEEEARDEALKYWDYYTPFITVKEKKKVKKTIHYAAQNYYTQEVWVDEDMDEDEIMDLWGGNQIEILNEPKIDDTRVNDIVSDIWVE